ncbi:MAG: ABC transporter ATP-binding protein [Candidatus Saccharimonadales bacterium]
MSEEIAIKVDNVSKSFKLPHEKVNSVKSIFAHTLRYVASKRSYEKQHALKNISLEVKKGEFFGIVGRNGSGKSTLLKMLAGIYQPSAGNIRVEGKLVPFIELGVGFNPELTGKQNVYLNGALLGFSKKEIDEQYEDIVQFAELHKFMDQKLKNYSSGMQVRLAFSMAVRAKADILLIDEVLAVGDADFQRKCFDYFKQLKKEHTTVVFVSHNMDAVSEYCDRAMLIEKNQVVKIGATNEVAEQYLKLFADNETKARAPSDGKSRWGDEAVKVSSIDVSLDSKEISIKLNIKSNQAIDNPLPGFRIRDASGKYVTGTNTKIEKKDLGEISKGMVRQIEWKFPNLLSDGEYMVDVAVLRSDNITVCDWWDEAAIFRVNKNRHLPYSLDPGFTTTVK